MAGTLTFMGYRLGAGRSGQWCASQTVVGDLQREGRQRWLGPLCKLVFFLVCEALGGWDTGRGLVHGQHVRELDGTL